MSPGEWFGVGFRWMVGVVFLWKSLGKEEGGGEGGGGWGGTGKETGKSMRKLC